MNPPNIWTILGMSAAALADEMARLREELAAARARIKVLEQQLQESYEPTRSNDG